jgi:3-phosphoshikimate 1-carboxyvinyltransferase
VITDAAELRVKETDRIEAVACELRKLGADLDTRPDGLSICGGKPLKGAAVSSWNDHRLAMSLAVAGLASAAGDTMVGDAGCIDVSFPGFAGLLASLGARVELDDDSSFSGQHLQIVLE